MGYKEFLRWGAFLDIEHNSFRTIDYYLAQIAAEVRRANSTKPESIQVSDFIIKFKEIIDTETPKNEVDETQRIQKSKDFWHTALLGKKHNEL